MRACGGTGDSCARIAIQESLPPTIDYKVSRRQAGMGCLRQPRFVAVAEHEGGCIAREIKAADPSAMVWNNGESGSGERYHHKAIASAVRSRDPYQETVKGWVLRRLSPDSNPIELDGLPKVRDEHTLLRALGEEAANRHLGSKKQISGVLKDLRGRKNDWLRKAANGWRGRWKRNGKNIVECGPALTVRRLRKKTSGAGRDADLQIAGYGTTGRLMKLALSGECQMRWVAFW
jgi:hypothetical protein